MTRNDASTAEQSILANLVSLWQQRHAEGQPATLAELCRDCPDLPDERKH